MFLKDFLIIRLRSTVFDAEEIVLGNLPSFIPIFPYRHHLPRSFETPSLISAQPWGKLGSKNLSRFTPTSYMTIILFTCSQDTVASLSLSVVSIEKE